MNSETLPAALVETPPTLRGIGQINQRLLLLAAGLILPIGALLCLEFCVRQGLVSARLLPAPSDIGEVLLDMYRNGTLATHIGISTLRVLMGFVAGSILGILVSCLVGFHRYAEVLLDATIQALRGIPALAWVPLLLIWLGIDEAPKITLIAMGAFFPVYLNLQAGIRNVDRKLIEVGVILGLERTQVIRRILIPAALPHLFTGLRQGLSLAWMFVVAAEMIAATKGIGFLLTDGRETSRPDITLAAIFLLALAGKLSDALLRRFESSLLSWRDVYQPQTP